MIIRFLAFVCVLELSKCISDANVINTFQSDIAVRKPDRDVDSQAFHSRTKRGWFSVVVYGTSILTRATSLGMTLSAAISGGCDPISGYPSICKDKDKIEELDKKIKILKERYDREFLRNKKEFLDLRTASTNNAFIEFYVNETVQKVQKMSDLQEQAYDILQVELPKLFKMYQSAQNYTSEQYLQALVGQLEASLGDIKKMIEDQVKNQLIGLGVQLLVEGLLNKFSNSYTNARNQILKAEAEDIFGTAIMTTLFTSDPQEAAIILDPNHARYDEIMQKHGLEPQTTKRTFKEKLKLTGKTFKGMLQNTKKYFKDRKTAFGKWKRIKTWKGFKGKFKASFKKPISKLGKVKSFITNSNFRKMTVKNFRLGWSQLLMTGIGSIFDIIQIAASKAEWYKVSVETAKARQKYQTYHDNLSDEIAKLEPEKRKMTKAWKDLTSAFKELSNSFKEIINYGKKNSEFNRVFGLSGLPINTQSPIFTIDFNSVTRNSLLGHQDSVMAFLRNINFNLTQINDQFRARNIMYKNIPLKTKEKDSIKTILNTLKDIYDSNIKIVIKQYGKKLAKKDVVCAVAKIRIDLTEYDFYPLSPFRPLCDVSDQQFATLDNAARQQQKMVPLQEAVKDQININDKQPVSALLATVKNAYSKLKDNEMKAFGSIITEQLVVCTVAKTFPNKQFYDFYSLSPFRPDCSEVSAADFARMKKSSETKKKLSKEVESALSICKKYSYCLCPKQIADSNNASETDVIAVMKYLEPDRKQYCGTGCTPKCVNL